MAEPIAAVVRPPATVPEWRRAEGRMQKFEVPGPSAAEAARIYARHLSESLESAAERIDLARRAMKYRTSSYGCWGEIPANAVLLVQPKAAFLGAEQEWSAMRERWKRARIAMRKRQQRLAAALAIVELAPGALARVPRRAQWLTRGPAPLAVRVYRDAGGMWYERRA